MNIEAYNLDYFQRLVRSLQDENKKLKARLDKANIAYEPQHVFEGKIETAEEYDSDQGGRILSKYITEDMVNRYFAMFFLGGDRCLCQERSQRRIFSTVQ